MDENKMSQAEPADATAQNPEDRAAASGDGVSTAATDPAVGERTPSGDEKRLPNYVIIIGAVVLVVVVLVAAVILLFGGRKTLSMDDYVSLNFSGVSGRGRAEVTVDYAAMAEMCDIQPTRTRSDWINNLMDAGSELVKYDAVRYAFSYELDADQGLTNGDRVEVHIVPDDEACKELGIKIREETLTFKVEDLMEVTAIDAFADIELEFSGISPAGTAKLTNRSRDDAVMSYTFSLDKSDGLSNGDVVTVSIDDYDLERIAENTGKVPQALSRQYTVSGLSSYVTELSQISAPALESMKKEVEDSLNAHVANHWDGDSEQLVGMNYLGSYLLIKKPHSQERSARNYLWLVYEVSYKNHWSGADYEMKYYFCSRYSGLYNDGQGNTVVDLSTRYNTAAQYHFTVTAEENLSHSFYVYGYPTLADLYKDCVTATMENFTSESSVN